MEQLYGSMIQLFGCTLQLQCAKMGNMDKHPFDQLLMDVFRELGVHRPEQVLPGWSLSLSEIYALSILEERGSLSQQELGVALSLEKSSISRLVEQLEQRGWIVRERDIRDNRLRLLRLTELGAEVTEAMHRHMHERHAELFNQLAPQEQAALLEGLTALRRALRSSVWKPNPPPDSPPSAPLTRRRSAQSDVAQSDVE